MRSEHSTVLVKCWNLINFIPRVSQLQITYQVSLLVFSSPNKAARDQQRQPIPYELRMENRVRVNAFGHGYGFLDLEANAI